MALTNTTGATAISLQLPGNLVLLLRGSCYRGSFLRKRNSLLLLLTAVAITDITFADTRESRLVSTRQHPDPAYVYLLNRTTSPGESRVTDKHVLLAEADFPAPAHPQEAPGISPQHNARLTHVTDISLEELEGDDTQLALDLDGPVSHDVFVFSEPDRIVLDLSNATANDSINEQNLNNGLVNLVRSGIHGESQLRIVLDLNNPAHASSLLQGPDSNGHYRLLVKLQQIPLPEPKQVENRTSPPASDSVSYESRLIQLKLDYVDAPDGSIDAIEYDAGYMLPLSQLFQLLGFTIEVHADMQLAEGWFINQNRNFVLDAAKSQMIINGVQRSIPAGLVQIDKREIYVDSTLLSQVLPVLLQIDPAALTLTIMARPGLSDAERTQLMSQWLRSRTEEPAPVKRAPAVEPETMAPVAEQKPAELSENNLIVLQPMIDDEAYADFIEVYQVGKRFLVPLQEFTNILRFPVTVDADKGVATGWYLSEDRSFSLDTHNRTVMLKGEKSSFSDKQVYTGESDIFVDTALLSEWFPLTTAVDLGQLTLTIHPQELLPFQIREQRLKNWERIQQARQKEKTYPLITTPYSLATMPFMDLILAQNIRNYADPRATTSFSLITAGDLAYMNSRLFISGDSVGKTIDTLRFNAGRQSDRASLLGPLKATQFSIGDINSISVPLVAQSSLGRGFSMSNRPVFQSSEFGATDFVGDALPDWEVELFHNGTLLELQVVGTDGRYEFLKVPILYGNNTFKLIFHGPQGQIREEIKRYNIDSSFPHRGDFNYELSVDEKSKSLFSAGDESIPSHPVETRLVYDMSYGIASSLVGALGVVSTPLEDGNHRYLTAGLRTGYAGILAGLEAAHDTGNGGRATKLFALASARNVNIKIEHKLFDKFHSEEVSDFSRQLDSESGLDLYSFLSLPIVGDLNFGINGAIEKFDTGEKRLSIKNRLSKAILGVAFSNTLERTTFENQETTIGDFSMRGHFWSTLIRANLYYSFSPESEVNSILLSAQRRIRHNMIGIVRFTSSLGTNTSRVYSGVLTWDRKDYKLSLSTEVNSNSDIAVNANLIFSLGRNPDTREWLMQSNPMSNSGALLANAYLDRNLSSQFDADDEAIDNSGYLVDKRRYTTDSGASFVTGLRKNRYVTVKIDPAALDDPLWQPAVEGYRLFPRAGVVTSLSFPVVASSEIDGILSLIDTQGNKLILSHVELQLIDADDGSIVKRFKSEYDGYYLFEKVPPGNYLIRVREQDLNLFEAVQIEEPKIIISADSDVYSGHDIQLVKKSSRSQ